MSNLTHLTACRLPESPGWPKKKCITSKFDQIVWFSHWKIPEINKCQGKKVYILAKDAITEIKFEIIAKKIFGLKKA